MKILLVALFACAVTACTSATGEAVLATTAPLPGGTDAPTAIPSDTDQDDASAGSSVPDLDSSTTSAPEPLPSPTPPPGTDHTEPSDSGDSIDQAPDTGPLPTTTPVTGDTSNPDDPSTQPSPASTDRPNTMFGPVACEGNERVQFSHFPLDAGIITDILPMGAMSGSHVTPVDHIYITHDAANQPGHGYVVRMPADGIVVNVGRMPNPDRPDYRIVIAHTCRIFTTFIHTGEPVAELSALIGELELGANWYGEFFIKAGDVLSDASTNTMDFMVHDAEVTLSGFIVPESYSGEAWKIHTVDVFDFYDEPLRSEVLVFNQRTAEPVGGKIDYDIDGRLVGNWFVEGTTGYSNGGNIDSRYVNYWDTHLAIAYHYIDPSTVIISIGDEFGIPEDACNVCAGAYGVKGNGPDPATIGVAGGLVKYELVGRIRPAPNTPTFNDESNLIGVFLAEMIDDRSVRIEIFPGAAVEDVAGFSGNAVVYTR